MPRESVLQLFTGPSPPPGVTARGRVRLRRVEFRSPLAARADWPPAQTSVDLHLLFTCCGLPIHSMGSEPGARVLRGVSPCVMCVSCTRVRARPASSTYQPKRLPLQQAGAEMESDRMSKHTTSLLAILALAAVPGVASAAQAQPSEPSAGIAALYPIPPAPTPAAAAQAAVDYLGTLSPAALAAAGGTKTVGGGGAITIKITLTKAGKAALKGAKGAFEVTVVATFKSKHGKAKTAKSTATLQ